MQQRVGIARALTRKPTILLMDEPFAALDAQTRENLQDDLLRIAAELKMTVLFVTHSIDEALVMSDRIVMLRSRPGRIRTIIPTPFGAQRSGDDVRAHAEFGQWRHSIRQMLKEEQRDV
jgi:NitT/TauT family transport system ATP-binding protein